MQWHSAIISHMSSLLIILYEHTREMHIPNYIFFFFSIHNILQSFCYKLHVVKNNITGWSPSLPHAQVPQRKCARTLWCWRPLPVTTTISFFISPKTRRWMDIEDVFAKIGGYGSSQKKILYILSSCHAYLCFVILILTFIGTEPPWSCSGGQSQAQGDCVSFERGECSPVYSLEFSSIVSEVLKLTYTLKILWFTY